MYFCLTNFRSYDILNMTDVYTERKIILIMTVGDLIKILEQYPMDLPIKTYAGDISIRYVDEFYDGDSANPKCQIIKALVIT